LAALRSLRASGLPWNTEALQAAAWAGHLEVLQYALEHACPWSDDVYACGWTSIEATATRGNQPHIVEWARARGASSAGAASASATGRKRSLGALEADASPVSQQELKL